MKRTHSSFNFSRDPNGATIALFNLHLHEPTDVSHQTVLQCVVFQVLINVIFLHFTWFSDLKYFLIAGRGSGGAGDAEEWAGVHLQHVQLQVQQL